MPGRALAETAAGLVLAVVFTMFGAAVIDLVDGTNAPTAAFGILWPTLLLWTVLVLIGNLCNRRRASGVKLLTGVVCTIAACLTTGVGWLVFSLTGGEWASILFAISLVPTAFFFVAATLALLVTHLGFFRRSATGA